MEKTVKKIIKTGFGLGLLSLAEAKKMASKVKKDLNLSEKESLKLANELVADSEKLSREFVKTGKRYLEAALNRSGIGCNKEFKKVKKAVKARIQKLKKRIKR